MASQAHGEPITGSSLTASPFSTKKKYRVRNWTQSAHHVAGAWHHVASSLAERSNPNTKANQTQSTKVFIKIKKKKKKKSLIHKPKSNPITHGRSRRRCRRRSELVVVVVARPIAPHRKSEIGERRSFCLYSDARCSPLDAPSGPPSRYFVLFLSNSLSVSRSLSHWN